VNIYTIHSESRTTIHYPNPKAYKVKRGQIKRARGNIFTFTFNISPDNPGYNLMQRMSTLIEVLDTRDNIERFKGRVQGISLNMDKDGIYKTITCEGELGFLHDSFQPSEIYEDIPPKDLLTTFLNIHNSQVEEFKKIQLGTVDVSDWLFATTNVQDTYSAIVSYVYKPQYGYLRLRKENGVKYLDYISNPQDKIITVGIGRNLLELAQSDDQDFGTRIIPVGANNLTIERVNNGLNYIEDSEAVSRYGIIYKTVAFSEVDSDETLKEQCTTQLKEYTTPKRSLKISMVDLATLAKVSKDMIDENTSINVQCPELGISETWRVITYTQSLDEPYNPQLEISNTAASLTGEIAEIVGSTIHNDGESYNGVQIGDSFGIRIKRDNVIMVLNAKEGFTITSDGQRVFYLDTDGVMNLVGVIARNMKAIDMEAEGGTFNNITANNGTFSGINAINMIAKDMKTSGSATDYILVHDTYLDVISGGKGCMSIGSISDSPLIGFINSEDSSKSVILWYEGDVLVTHGDINFKDNPRVGSSLLATQDWVDQNYVKKTT
jgi:hypothetical protein